MVKSHLVRLASLVMFCIPSMNVYADLVTNMGFEDGTVGWEIAGGGVGVCLDAACQSPNSGHRAGFKNGMGTVSQAVSTVPGTTYLVDVFLARNAPANGQVTVSFGSTVGVIATNGELPFATSSGYAHFSFSHTASSESTELIWDGTIAGGTFFLDDVSVTAVPEPGSLALLLPVALAAIGRRRRA